MYLKDLYTYKHRFNIYVLLYTHIMNCLYTSKFMVETLPPNVMVLENEDFEWKLGLMK